MPKNFKEWYIIKKLNIKSINVVKQLGIRVIILKKFNL